jgi:DNA-binding MarR family transcriptional regulator
LELPVETQFKHRKVEAVEAVEFHMSQEHRKVFLMIKTAATDLDREVRKIRERSGLSTKAFNRVVQDLIAARFIRKTDGNIDGCVGRPPHIFMLTTNGEQYTL